MVYVVKVKYFRTSISLHFLNHIDDRVTLVSIIPKSIPSTIFIMLIYFKILEIQNITTKNHILPLMDKHSSNSC